MWGLRMWEICSDLESARLMATEGRSVYSLYFVDEPVYLVRAIEVSFGGLESKSLAQSKVTTTKRSRSKRRSGK